MKRSFIFLKSTWFILLAIVLLGSFLRLYNLGEKSFVADEFLGVNATYGFLQTGQFNRWDFNFDEKMQDLAYPRTFFDFDIWKGGEETYIRAWAYNWQVAQFLRFFNPEKESSYRLASALWGIIFILLVYFVTEKITGKKKIALIGAFFMAISLMSVEFSRKMRMYAMFAPTFFIFSYFIFNFLESESKTKIKALKILNKNTGFNFVYFLPAFLTGLLSAHLHLLALNMALIIIVYWLVMAVFYFLRTKKIYNKYTNYLGIGFFSFMMLSFFSSKFLSLPKVFLKPLTHFSYLEIVFSDYSSWLLTLILIMAGTFYLIRKNEKAGIFFTTIFWSILILAVFFWKSNVGDRFIYFIKPFQIMLLASGIYAIAKYLRNNIKKNGRKVFAFCLLTLILVTPNFAGFFGDDGPYVQNSRSSEPNYRKIFSYFNKKRKAEDVLITRNFRNFYFKNDKVKVYSLGGERTEKDERRIELKDLQEITMKNKCGWIIFSDSDSQFISKEAEEYIMKNFSKVDNSSVRGPISLFTWCNREN